MTIYVNQIVLHQLSLDPTSKQDLTEGVENPPTRQFITHLRQELLPNDQDVGQMMLQLHQVYQGKNKSYAVFQENSVFAQELNRYLEDERDFLTFSQNCAAMLSQELNKYTFTTGGTFILSRYQFLATDYLFIALLDNKTSMLVDEGLNIQQTHYLDLNSFDIVARINLTELQLNANSNRYLTFLKGRVGRKIGDFFMDFLSAEEGLNPQTQNQCLLQAVSDYCEQADLNMPQTQAVKKQVFDYCKNQLSNGEEITLTELAETMPTLNQQNFAEFAHTQDYGLEESIPPLRSTLKSLTKLSGSGKGITLSFDLALLNQRIFWNEKTDTLTIQGLPPNLKDQLRKQTAE
ncbi:nucleoid-associated protein YejK [Mergibacter septicus]|uniref:Nucleoid-associated protein CEP48_01645 n=1 Tax=Mergibacter septicus TaxID=221402 RepID=A0A8E3MG26_9PAST|nr:nucleoid-associated protein YejK [Mergibacter septicus]AWX14952.1 nucleoid-associated protein YejK [Mergibacter septicus]QDJ12392.1 nucleoid-associated protein YejK [Mergibacter septicus]QDJ14204.1 nucleoid-associated protein YejK [Mergibacter septicus]UTU48349.1 nucleoid-associated protein YejK [Mergibacter septicus]WMR96024.1 nucleoid-associated protein YejK [Mergibacter septicus]